MSAISVSRSLSQFPTRCADWIQRHYFIFVCVILGILCLNELWLFGTDLAHWDFMLVSGTITFVIGLRLVFGLPRKVTFTLTRLVNRGVLPLTTEQLANLKDNLESRAERWAQRGGLIVGAVIMVAFGIAFGQAIVHHLDLAIVEALGGYIAGRYLGQMVCYGSLGPLLKQLHIPLAVQPGHLDEVAGLKPVGDLYFFQAMVVAIPALYLAVWWFLIPAFQQYSDWRDPYLGLLGVVLTVELLAFLVPLSFFHQEMQKQRAILLGEADKLGQAVGTVQAALTEAKTEQERDELKNRLSSMTERYWAIERMPTWPVDTKVRRWFTFNNLALFLPLLSQSLHVTGGWQKALDELQKILTQISSST